jgi:hypothetical protein
MYTDQEKPRLNKFKILIFLNFVLDVEKANSLNISILIDFLNSFTVLFIETRDHHH